MSDRELIEMAAKAAGIGWSEWDHDRLREAGQEVGRDMLWNPLENDTHALRLAVKLQLMVFNEHATSGVAYCADVAGHAIYSAAPADPAGEGEVTDLDYAATRRAITLAAAEIGRSM